MEPADHYLSFLTRTRAPDLDALHAALAHTDPASVNPAAFSLLHLALLKDKAPDDYAWLHGALVGAMKLTMFSKMRLRTNIAVAAAIASCLSPGLPLRQATPQTVTSAIQANAQAPIYQTFLRAVDRSWDEMLRAAPSLSRLTADLHYDLQISRLGPHHARAEMTGRDALAFGVYIMPGFLRGIAPQLSISLHVEVIDEDAGLALLDLRWSRL